MDIVEATRKYETWLGQRIPLIETDLEMKHQAMRQAAFPFLRATFYRWVQLWPQVCPELGGAPLVLSVGDLHVENFGTWRDAEGRLAWGINDFDETASLPYTQDLVRLASSLLLAIQENLLAIHPQEACEAILAGYQKSLSKGGLPIVLAESQDRLREMALSQIRSPVRFWNKIDLLPSLNAVPPDVAALLKDALPDPDLDMRVVHRSAGLGSLGRQRYMALASWHGGLVAREAKQMAVSACTWEMMDSQPGKTLYQGILNRAVRDTDPFTYLQGDWLVRRIAPDCFRIELANLPRARDETHLLAAMGWETANVHLNEGPEKGARILSDLKSRPNDWLQKASRAMADALIHDWETWKKV